MTCLNNNELIFTSSKTSDAPNKYLMLLKRLDEEEGLSDPSIEEKLKLAEDHLKLSCVKFCEATATLVDGKKTDTTDKDPIAEVDTVQKLFEPKCFKPSLRPPKSQLKSISQESGKLSSLKPTNDDLEKNLKARKKLQQAYYLPPSTWFSSDMAGADLSNEEVELLSSCATKTFVKFLEEKKMEVPKIFTHILEKRPQEQI